MRRGAAKLPATRMYGGTLVRYSGGGTGSGTVSHWPAVLTVPGDSERNPDGLRTVPVAVRVGVLRSCTPCRRRSHLRLRRGTSNVVGVRHYLRRRRMGHHCPVGADTGR